MDQLSNRVPDWTSREYGWGKDETFISRTQV